MHTPTPLDSAIMASMAGEASFQHLFMANPQPMWIFDLSTLRFLAVNQAALQHYGYSQAEFLDLTIRDIRPPEDVTRLLDVLSEQASPFKETGLWKHLTRDGRVIDVEVTTHLIQFAGQRAKLVLINDVSEHLRAERALREHEARLRLFIEHAPVALAMFDRDMRYLAASRRWQDDYGLGHHPLDGRCHYEVFPEIGARWRELHQRGLQGEALNCEAERFVRQDGRVQWLRWTIHPWRDDQGDVGGIVIFTEDISERKRTEETLRQSATIFESMRDGVLITDLSPAIVAVNRAYTDITGYTLDEVRGLNPSLLRSGRHDHDFYQLMWKSVLEEGHWVGEIWNRRKSGELYPQLLSISTVYDPQGAPCNYVGVFTDISQVRQSEARLEHLAHFDPLTDLPNRLLAYSRLQHAIERGQRTDRRVAALLIDIDRFKNVNDSLGHHIGDQLLQAAAARLRAVAVSVDTVARLGGDEFTVILENISDVQHVAKIAKKLVSKLNGIVKIEQQEVFVTASIGIAIFPEDGEAPETLLMNADTAMYRAKERGKNNFQFFTSDMNTSTMERMRLENSLHAALSRSELLLHYQPKLKLDTGELFGYEALIRWNHPQMGMVSPAQFIPIAEDSSLIVPIGDWVLHTACAQARRWLDRGDLLGRMAVNISHRQLKLANLVDSVHSALQHSGLPAECLELEITESMAMDTTQETLDTLVRLREMGVHLTIDDFGTGYSSLSYLRKLPIDGLKIDRSFVAGVVQEPGDAAITRAIISLAASLGLAVTAEGIEEASQLAFLREQGCPFGQGYFYCRPMDVARLDDWLAARRRELAAYHA